MKPSIVFRALCGAAALAALLGVPAARAARPSPPRGKALRARAAEPQRAPAARPRAAARPGRAAGRAEGAVGRVRPAGRGAVLARALAEVGVTAEQRRQLRAIRGRHDEAVRGIGRRLVTNQRALTEALNGPAPSAERGRALARERAALLAERERARTGVELEVFKTLTPEQRARLRAMRDGRAAARPEGIGPLARRPGRLPREAGADRPEAPMRQVGLSRDQFARVRELRQRRGPALRELTARVRETQRAIDDALLAPSVDETRVRALAEQLGRLEGERALQRFETELELRALLTPDQLRRLVEARRRLRERLEREGAPRDPDANDDEGGAPGSLDTPPDPVL